MVRIKIISVFFLCALFFDSCTQEKKIEKGKEVFFTLEASKDDTKTTYSESMSKALWQKNDRLGITYSYNGMLSPEDIALFQSVNSEPSSSARFNGYLWDNEIGEYIIYGIYPYHGFHSGNDNIFFLPEIQYPSRNDWDPDCDIMLAKCGPFAVDSISDINPNLQFDHLVGWMNIDFSGISLLYPSSVSEKVLSVSVSSETPLAGSCTLNLENQSIERNQDSKKKLVADYGGREVLFGNLKAFITLFPGEYESFTITVKTEHHTLTFIRGAVHVKSGNIVDVSMSHKESDVETEEDNGVFTSIDSKSPVNILMFGHSLGIDYTEYLPLLLEAANITNVSVYRVATGNCSLQTHWERIRDNQRMDISYCPAGSTSYVFSTVNLSDFLKSKAWDIVLLQTSLEYEGQYNYIQPYLDNIEEYLAESNHKLVGKEPIFGWHFFWPVAPKFVQAIDYYTSYYKYNSMQMYCCYRDVAKEILKNTNTKFVVPTGTAMVNLRMSDLNTDSANEFTRDGLHADMGAGRYIVACALFESVIQPLFGVTCLGNTFRVGSGDHVKVPVTDENAAVIQSYAIKAVKSKFEITYD